MRHADYRSVFVTNSGHAGQPCTREGFDTLAGHGSVITRDVKSAIIPGEGTPIVFEFDFDPASSFVRVRFSGVLQSPESLDSVRVLIGDPRYKAGMNGLIDLREVESIELRGANVRSGADLVVRLGDAFTGSRWALLATSDAVFGIARQFELMVSDPRFEMRAFRDLAAAEHYLHRAP